MVKLNYTWPTTPNIDEKEKEKDSHFMSKDIKPCPEKCIKCPKIRTTSKIETICRLCRLCITESSCKRPSIYSWETEREYLPPKTEKEKEEDMQCWFDMPTLCLPIVMKTILEKEAYIKNPNKCISICPRILEAPLLLKMQHKNGIKDIKDPKKCSNNSKCLKILTTSKIASEKINSPTITIKKKSSINQN